MSVKRARTLRKNMSPAEARVWNLLREAPFRDFHFRRQVPIGPFYADFASHAARLVIEIDGDTHYMDGAAERDAERSAFINREGYGVVRFTNLDVMCNPDGVAQLLVRRLTPTPVPSPQGGGRP